MELQEKDASTATLHNNDNNEKPTIPHDNNEKQTIPQKMRSAIKLITIEPVLFLYLFASSLALGALLNMSFEMACRVNLSLNDTICSKLALSVPYSRGIVTYHHAWSQPLQTTLTAVLVLCFGSFSDRHKIRKPFFVLPVLGEVLSCVGLILCAVFINQWPVQMYYVMAILLPSFFGGGQTIIMAIYSYITDISTKEERTSRIGFVEIISLILTPIGPAVSGVLYLKIGYYGVYSICLVLFASAALYGSIFIKEKRPPAKLDKNVCVDVFNIKTVVIEMFKILIRKRIAYRRMLLIFTYVCYILIKGPVTAESLYIRNYAIYTFHWGVDYFGYFQAFDIIVHVLGMLVAVTIFTKKLKLNDIIIAVIACIVKLIVGMWYAFGTNVIMFLIGPLISVFSGLFVISLRSLVTKLVDVNEIAKAQALFAICEAICPIIYSSIYYQFDQATNTVFPGAFYLLSTALVTLPLFILLGMYVVYKQDVDNSEQDQQDETQENGAYENRAYENGRQENGRQETYNVIETERL